MLATVLRSILTWKFVNWVAILMISVVALGASMFAFACLVQQLLYLAWAFELVLEAEGERYFAAAGRSGWGRLPTNNPSNDDMDDTTTTCV